MKREVIITADGSKTIFLPDIQEQYHSKNGAITESEYVFIEKGYLYHTSKTPAILEIGFGTGLNCFLTAIQAERQKRNTLYFAIDNCKLEQSLIKELDYGNFNLNLNSAKIFEYIHSCRWGVLTLISNYFQLYKINVDFTSEELPDIKPCDIIYFDAFGPDKQPEMWTPKIFNKIYDLTSAGGVFVTYSAKGEVRRQLGYAGFDMQRLPGPPGKKEMLRGRKIKSII